MTLFRRRREPISCEPLPLLPYGWRDCWYGHMQGAVARVVLPIGFTGDVVEALVCKMHLDAILDTADASGVEPLALDWLP